MRLAIISDIHGNYRALQSVLEDIDSIGVDDIISLGDNIGYGPEPEEVVQALLERKIDSVMGNHELGLASDSAFQRLNPAPRHSLELTRQLMGKKSLQFSISRPPFLVRHKARFVHGCPPASITAYLWNPTETRLSRLFAGYSETICFFGHTHNLSRFQMHDGRCLTEHATLGRYELQSDCRYIINPGSVGQPRDTFNNKAKYGIWHMDKMFFEQRAVAYDVQRTVELLAERKFPESNAIRLL
ncbi:MAG: metallophosphoesterase family protein [Pseudomonadota bacterium]